MKQNKAVVLLSGGLDSSTCVAVAQRDGAEVYAMSFDYGQRHRSELEAASRVAVTSGVKVHHVVPLDVSVFQGSALTEHAIEVPDYREGDGIPVTYVPARNTLFLAYALAWAESIGAQSIYAGMSHVDYSGYPDCRPEFVDAFQALIHQATQVGVEGDSIALRAPLLHLSKAQTIALGMQLGVDYSLTVSCYQADEDGRACGRCDSCVLRRRGFEQAGVDDPTRYVISAGGC